MSDSILLSGAREPFFYMRQQIIQELYKIAADSERVHTLLGGTRHEIQRVNQSQGGDKRG